MGSEETDPDRGQSSPPPQSAAERRTLGSEDDLSDDYVDAAEEGNAIRLPPQELLHEYAKRFEVLPCRDGARVRRA